MLTPASQLSQFNSLLATSPELGTVISRAVSHERQDPAEFKEHGIRNICKTLRQTHQEPSTSECSLPGALPRSACTCKWFNRTDRYEPLSILHFRKVFRRRHFACCPRSKTSEETLEYMMRIVPPKWLLSHTIHLGCSLRMRAITHGFSIAPIVFGTSRVVDRWKSPAFLLFGNFEKDLSSTTEGSELVNTLENSLRGLFDTGLSSPADEDQYGNSILYVRPVTP